MKMSLNWFDLCQWSTWVLNHIPPFSSVSLNVLARYFVSFHFSTSTFVDGLVQWLKVRKVLVSEQSHITRKWRIQRDKNGLCHKIKSPRSNGSVIFNNYLIQEDQTWTLNNRLSTTNGSMWNQKKIRNYLEANKIKAENFKNLIGIKTYLKKQEKSQISNLTYHLKKSGKNYT